MSMFLASFADDPEEQRFTKAVIHLRLLVFSRLSDDHVLALALVHELGELYRRAFSTEQVLHDGSAHHNTQEEALTAHLHGLGLPATLAELEPHEVAEIVKVWERGYENLPGPFDRTLQTFVLHAKTQLAAGRAQAVSSYQAQ